MCKEMGHDKVTATGTKLGLIENTSLEHRRNNKNPMTVLLADIICNAHS